MRIWLKSLYEVAIKRPGYEQNVDGIRICYHFRIVPGVFCEEARRILIASGPFFIAITISMGGLFGAEVF